MFLLTTSLLSAGTVSEGEEPSLTRLRNQTRDLLRAEATAERATGKAEAAEALCDWYVVLRHDERYSDSKMLQSDASKIRRRLLSIASRQRAQLRRDGIARPNGLAAEVDAEIARALSDQTEDNSASAGDRPGSRAGAAGGAGVLDEGWRLVELIERVVAPDFWESRGGPGVVRYFAMRRVLVVRATSDVHEQIKDLLMALR